MINRDDYEQIAGRYNGSILGMNDKEGFRATASDGEIFYPEMYYQGIWKATGTLPSVSPDLGGVSFYEEANDKVAFQNHIRQSSRRDDWDEWLDNYTDFWKIPKEDTAQKLSNVIEEDGSENVDMSSKAQTESDTESTAIPKEVTNTNLETDGINHNQNAENLKTAEDVVSDAESVQIESLNIEEVKGSYGPQLQRVINKYKNTPGLEDVINVEVDVPPDGIFDPVGSLHIDYKNREKLEKIRDRIEHLNKLYYERDRFKKKVMLKNVVESYDDNVNSRTVQEYDLADSLRMSKVLLLKIYSNLENETGVGATKYMAMVDQNSIKDQLREKTRYGNVMLSEKDIYNIAKSEVLNTLPSNEQLYGALFVNQEYLWTVESKARLIAMKKEAKLDKTKVQTKHITAESFIPLYLEYKGNEVGNVDMTPKNMERFKNDGLKQIIKISVESEESVIERFYRNYTSVKNGEQYVGLGEFNEKNQNLIEKLTNSSGRIDSEGLVLLYTLQMTQKEVAMRTKLIKENNYLVAKSEAAYEENRRMATSSLKQRKEMYPGMYDKLRENFTDKSNKEFDLFFYDVCDMVADNNEKKYRYNRDLYTQYMKIMLKEDMIYNLDAAAKNMVYSIIGLVNSDFIHDQRVMNAAAELANKNGASPLGEWGGNFIKNYSSAIGLLVASVFVGGATLPAALIKVYGGIEKINSLQQKWDELSENPELTEKEMLDELLIHGMRITALEVVGEAGNYAGIKVAKRYTIEEPIQNATGGGASIIIGERAEYLANENNQTKDHK